MTGQILQTVYVNVITDENICVSAPLFRARCRQYTLSLTLCNWVFIHTVETFSAFCCLPFEIFGIFL